MGMASSMRLAIALLFAACGVVVSITPPIRLPASMPVGSTEQATGVPTAVSITVPGHFSNFKEAIEKGPEDVGTILVQPGEHRWENFLEIGQQLDIRGSNGALLPGSLWMKKSSGGEMQGVEMAKESGSCIIFEGGQWVIDSCRLVCSRWAVLWCRCECDVSIKNCFMGGLEDGPGYCVNCQDHARTTVEGCHLERSSGEYCAAVAVFHSVRTRVQNCNFHDNQFAFRAVTAKDATLELIGNNINGEMWYDSVRPGNLVEHDNSQDGVHMSEATVQGASPEGFFDQAR
uniref:Right handed beta helix domain-containing protein n=1 Tax=Guillardia theta TaxID=55529 RepID=A0A6U5Y4Y8_GUITH|mmetsp:Transcript_20751/g.69315  ORF Transcript_20751/g.69315 Transcript_20751/m.69315 type:complete len:288 (+) Transcript_20751:293-1156(+)